MEGRELGPAGARRRLRAPRHARRSRPTRPVRNRYAWECRRSESLNGMGRPRPRRASGQRPREDAAGAQGTVPALARGRRDHRGAVLAGACAPSPTRTSTRSLPTKKPTRTRSGRSAGTVGGQQPRLVVGPHARQAGVDHLTRRPASAGSSRARYVSSSSTPKPKVKESPRPKMRKPAGRVPRILAAAVAAGVDAHGHRPPASEPMRERLDGHVAHADHGVLDEEVGEEGEVLGPEGPQRAFEGQGHGQHAGAGEDEVRDQAPQGREYNPATPMAVLSHGPPCRRARRRGARRAPPRAPRVDRVRSGFDLAFFILAPLLTLPLVSARSTSTTPSRSWASCWPSRTTSRASPSTSGTRTRAGTASAGWRSSPGPSSSPSTFCVLVRLRGAAAHPGRALLLERGPRGPAELRHPLHLPPPRGRVRHRAEDGRPTPPSWPRTCGSASGTSRPTQEVEPVLKAVSPRLPFLLWLGRRAPSPWPRWAARVAGLPRRAAGGKPAGPARAGPVRGQPGPVPSVPLDPGLGARHLRDAAAALRAVPRARLAACTGGSSVAAAGSRAAGLPPARERAQRRPGARPRRAAGLAFFAVKELLTRFGYLALFEAVLPAAGLRPLLRRRPLLGLPRSPRAALAGAVPDAGLAGRGRRPLRRRPGTTS